MNDARNKLTSSQKYLEVETRLCSE